MRALLVVGFLATLTLAGCASSSDDGYTTPTQDDQGRYVINLTAENKVVPAMAKVPVGATVVWRVSPNGFHDVTSKSGPESFTSDTAYPSKMRGGQEFARTFSKTGDYEYECMVHQGMMGAKLRVA